jgi:hypothetical protein
LCPVMLLTLGSQPTIVSMVFTDHQEQPKHTSNAHRTA